MCNLGLGFLPIAFVACFLVGLWTSYALAVYFGSISPVWPYISDTGVDLPETCIFSLCFNISAFLALVIMFIRFQFIQNVLQESDQKLGRLSKFNMGFGCISTFGFLLVANFPDAKLMECIHYIGAAHLFLFGNIYAVVDSKISRQLPGSFIVPVRIALVTLSICTMVITFVTEVIAWVQWSDASPPLEDSWMLYQAGQPGYTAHLVSAISEWLMAGFFLSYFLTYVHEFRHFDLKVHVYMSPATVTQSLRPTGVLPASERTSLVSSQIGGTWRPTTESDVASTAT